jgi:predicted RNA-binding protein associated with RNAse of E/G family
MREKGLTTMDDYRAAWAKADANRAARRNEKKMPSRTRREAIARALYQMRKP